MMLLQSVRTSRQVGGGDPDTRYQSHEFAAREGAGQVLVGESGAECVVAMDESEPVGGEGRHANSAQREAIGFPAEVALTGSVPAQPSTVSGNGSHER